MMEEIEISKQWVAKAKNDLLNADNNLKSEEIPYDTVCFHCQQASEKLLKAYLTAKRETPPVTHDLILLLEKVLPLNSDAEGLRDDLATLTPYAVEIRYPDGEARDAAGRVLMWLQRFLPDVFTLSRQ